MRTHLTILLLFLATAARADLGPTLRWTASARGPISPGVPLGIELSLTNVSGGVVEGPVQFFTTPKVTLLTTASTAPVHLAEQATARLALVVRPEATGLSEVRVQLQDPVLGPQLYRFFLRAEEAGGRLLTISEALDTESTGTLSLPAGRYQVFPLRLRPASVGSSRTGNLEITGALSFDDAAGQSAPADRVTVGAYQRNGTGWNTLAGATLDRQGKYRLSIPRRRQDSAPVEIYFNMEGKRWCLRNGSGATYSFAGPKVTQLQGAVDLGELHVTPTLLSSEVLWIHQTMTRIEDRLAPIIADLSWWPKLPIHWPANGDYFMSGELYINRPGAWAVIAHEFGHAAYHFGTTGAMSGGFHRITDCYTSLLAWSEGWATFWGAVIFVDPNAENPTFPVAGNVAIENVPASVCQGETNEWRVTAALWDIYDRHEDGVDKLGVSMETIWATLRKQTGTSSLKMFIRGLKEQLPAEQQQLLPAVLRQNTITPE
jgi:hypothetical protein